MIKQLETPNGTSSPTVGNMSIWNEVCQTDPTYTKATNNGKYDFTAVDPQYQLLEATKLWGPYGTAWGLRNVTMAMQAVPGADGKTSLFGQAEFFYPGGAFEIHADMPYRWNDDACKKLWTSLRSKSLSALGFNADIFLGEFEDEQYVAAMRTKFGDQEELRKKALGTIRGAKNESSLSKCKDRIETLFSENAINKTMFNELMEEIDLQKREIQESQPTTKTSVPPWETILATPDGKEAKAVYDAHCGPKATCDANTAERCSAAWEKRQGISEKEQADTLFT